MKMTFDEYIVNPMGVNNAVFSHRELFRDLYTKKLDLITVREAGKFDYFMFFDKKKGDYYLHVKVPSEVIEKFYYDVVIKFYTDDQTIANSKSLKKYNVRFFSNDPSFVYTFAHAMHKNDMLVEELSSKMSKLAMTKEGKIKNPKNEIGYVKSIYFAYLIATRKNLFTKDMYTIYGEPYSKNTLLSRVEHADDKIAARQDAATTLAKKKKIEKNKEVNKIESRTNNITKKSNNTKSLKISKTSKVSNKLKKTSKSKRI